MKKIISFVAVVLLFTNCTKTKTPSCPYTESAAVASAAEIAEVQNYLFGKGITNAIQHPSGMFYKITNAGTGTVTPTVCNFVSVKYEGYLTTGNKFEDNTSGFTLGEVILGWQKGVPLIKTGGQITLYIPASLAYGTQVRRDAAGNIVIPGNSILIFNISLIAIN
jgi:FKBP-type peptidyl-prolyl cis-trans isomerase FkpA